MNSSLRRALMVTAATAFALSPVFLVAGPLDPPPGPVAPTGRTMILSMPAIISTPGSYYLARTFDPSTPSLNISISSSNVTLDLGGTTLVRGPGNNSMGAAISIADGVSNVVIRNGAVGGGFGSGIRGPSATRCTVDNVSICQNTLGAEAYAVALGDEAVIRDCTISNNYRSVNLGHKSRLERCTISHHAGGVIVGDSSIIADCVLEENGYFSSPNVSCGANCLIRDCVIADNNLSSALAVGTASIVRSCTVTFGGGGGGIVANDGCLVESCTLQGDASDGGTAMWLGASSVARACTVSVAGTRVNGIRVGPGGAVSNCTINTAATHVSSVAVIAADNSMIDANVIVAPTVTGITLSGTGTRVIRNSIKSPTPIVDPGGNDVGPTGSAASATSPWANLTN